MEKYIVLKGITMKHGDVVKACLLVHDTDEPDYDNFREVEAVLSINDEDADKDGRAYTFHLCQDDIMGCDSADDFFGCSYSWIVHINKDTNELSSSDTDYVIPIGHFTTPDKNLYCNPCEIPSTLAITHAIVLDDDPMPENWVNTEKIPVNL